MSTQNFLLNLAKKDLTAGIIGRYARFMAFRGSSMSPTLNPHSNSSTGFVFDGHVLVQKYKFSRGDVVVFRCCSRKLSTASGGVFDREVLPPSSSLLSRTAQWLMHQELLQPTLSRRAPPWLMLPPAFSGNNMVYNFYSPTEKKVVNFSNRGGKQEAQLFQDQKTTLVGSSHGWLALFNAHSGDFFLSNPLSGHRIKLPSVGFPSKVIISCSPNEEEECRALISFGAEDKLAFCCPNSSNEWTRVGVPNRSYTDFVYSSAEKRFLCLSQDLKGCIRKRYLESWDVREGSWKEMPLDGEYNLILRYEFEASLIRYWHDFKTTYLVFAEQSNQLFLVTRYIVKIARDGSPAAAIGDDDVDKHHLLTEGDIYPLKTVDFCVHRIGMGAKSCYLEDSFDGLDGLAIFVGINHSLVLSLSDFPQLKPNSIYFTDDTFTKPDAIYGGHDNGIYNYQNKTWTPCNFEKIDPKPIWYTPSPV